eukprot:scaffold1156_cov394-Prasinococcus_capsulatus_cf.AAC.15
MQIARRSACVLTGGGCSWCGCSYYWPRQLHGKISSALINHNPHRKSTTCVASIETDGMVEAIIRSWASMECRKRLTRRSCFVTPQGKFFPS